MKDRMRSSLMTFATHKPTINKNVMFGKPKKCHNQQLSQFYSNKNGPLYKKDNSRSFEFIILNPFL